MTAAVQSFTAERSELPMLYVLLALGSIELLVVHLLVSLASPAAAWVLSAVTILGVVQIATIVRRVKRRPTLVTGDGLVIRSAKGYELTLPWNRVAAVEPIGFGPEPKGPDVLRASLLSHPNVLVRATEPFTVRQLGLTRTASAAALRVDQPAAFLAAARKLAR